MKRDAWFALLLIGVFVLICVALAFTEAWLYF